MIQAKAQWQGFAGVVHGGMVSTLLDAAMTHCLFTRGVEAMTASLKVRFLAPVRCTDLLKITATFTKQRRHVYFLDAELTSPGKVLARAEASFVRRINTLQIQDDSMECPVNLA